MITQCLCNTGEKAQTPNGTADPKTQCYVGQRSTVLTQVTANNCMHIDTLAKHRALNSEAYTAMLSLLIKECENRT